MNGAKEDDMKFVSAFFDELQKIAGRIFYAKPGGGAYVTTVSPEMLKAYQERWKARQSSSQESASDLYKKRPGWREEPFVVRREVPIRGIRAAV